MNKLPQISDAEFEVMDIIWKYAPISTNEITDRLAKTKNWSPKTIYTMLSRLEKKGVIVHEKESRVFVYTPCVKKDDYLAAESWQMPAAQQIFRVEMQTKSHLGGKTRKANKPEQTSSDIENAGTADCEAAISDQASRK